MLIVYILIFGLVVFASYALIRGFSFKEVLVMCRDGIWSARNVLITFLLIGILTALWRAAGTIPVIVCYAKSLIKPSVFYLMTFLLCCGVSVLTGTAFGTAATMGVVCAAMGDAMQMSTALTGGAVLAGSYFGDRCSPVSTSALLVSELTETSIFDNIRDMIKTALIPFIATCLIYGVLGLTVSRTHLEFDLTNMFGRVFQLHWSALCPAILILILSAFRIPVKKAMLLSILSAIPICLFLQKITIDDLFRFALSGYKTADTELAPMINGGGIISMLRVSAIVCISSAYSGIFRKTNLLDKIYGKMEILSDRMTTYGATLVASVIIGAVACNQTLTILLTKQLCENIEADKHRLAINLENTAVVVAPLIPWSIAGGVPLSSVGAPTTGLLCAFFLFLLPVYSLVKEIIRKRRRQYSSILGKEITK